MSTSIIYTTNTNLLPKLQRSLNHISNTATLNSFYQRTPLHNAAEGGYERTVECLVNQGANVNIKDNDGVGL